MNAATRLHQFTRVLFVVGFAEAIVTVLSLLLRHASFHKTAPAAFWTVAFCFLTALVCTLLRRHGDLFGTNRRGIKVALAASLWAVFAYTAVTLGTAGYIANVNAPLFLTFMAGSVTAFVDVFWSTHGQNADRQAFIGLILIIGIGLVPSAWLLLGNRQHQTRIIVVKYTPTADSNLLVELDHSVAESARHDIERVQQLPLRGKGVITLALNLGPDKPPFSRMIIVVHSGLSGTVQLAEPIGDVAYIQQSDSSFIKLPSDLRSDRFEIELEPVTSGTLISVWRNRHQRLSFQAVQQ